MICSRGGVPTVEKRIALNPEFDTFTGDAEIQTLLAQLGMGIALLPLWLAHSSVESGKLRTSSPGL